ncbi:hypothetical protein [Ensifer aridi]|uniref:hypothetical protein n=1 Tax=Ensifer aridi TaxID=1708715 RepID=UPI000A11AFCB|nr:hypothetical protein [Ensifer aridi]
MALAMLGAMDGPDIRLPSFTMLPSFNFGFRGATKRRRTGKLYPHSSERQRARYARQIAAGQLRIDSVQAKAAPVKKTRRAKVAANV